MNKKHFIIFVLICWSIFSFSINQNPVKLQDGNSTTKITTRSEVEFSVYNKISDFKFQTSNLKSKNFTEINLEGYHKSNIIGEPNLPQMSKLIEIPENANYEIKIISYDEQVINLKEKGILNKIAPSQASVSKSQKSENTKFYINEKTYLTNSFYKNKIASIEIIGKMRGTTIGRLTISPFQYNPVTNTLKVINNLKFEVVFKNANLLKTKEISQKKYSPYFETNFNKLANHIVRKDKDLISKYPIKYVIVADRMFESSLQSFIEWKIQKGFTVITAYTDQPEVGTTTTSIKNYIKSLYDSGTPQSPAPTFVLLVGDIEQIPAFTGVSSLNHVTDLYYCEIDGNGDYFPDMYYGRFSAKTISELQSQINKTLQYEEYLMPSKDFLNEVVLIAGVDATYGPVNGNGQINYAANNYLNSTAGITSHTYLYPTSGSSTSSIINNINSGASFVNYTAHCDWDGWTNPTFNVTSIPNLTNIDKYPFVISNCCLSNKFNVDECFTESIVRAVDKGAVAAIGASNETLWDEDFYWSVGVGAVTANPTYATTSLGAYDRLFHENGEAVDDWFVTGSQIVNAGNLAVTQSGSIDDFYYWEIYHLMGDPSLIPYIGVPNTLSISYNNSIPVGTSSIQIVTEPNTYVALSINGILYDAVLSDVNGFANLNTSNIINTCLATIVATKQDRQPYLGTLNVVPNNSAYIIFNSVSINDSTQNNNSNADYNETVFLNLNVKNVGSLDANLVSVKISCLDSNITIIRDSANVSFIQANELISINDTFQIKISDKIENNHDVSFSITCTDSNDSIWISSFVITIYAPKLELEYLLVNDSTENTNGRIDLNETVNLKIKAINNGGVEISNLTCSISTINPYIVINTNNISILTLASLESIPIEFNISVLPNIPVGTSVDFVFDIVSGNYSAQLTKTLKIGEIIEDWESSNFSSFNWQTNTWQVSNTNSYEGIYTANSGTVANNNSSSLKLTLFVEHNDTISFYKKVSSESGYDYLRFYIDGVEKNKWSGEVAWSISKYGVSSGFHTFEWLYSKDQEISAGSDKAYIDFISLPAYLNVPEFISNPIKTVQISELYEYNILVTDKDSTDTIQLTCSNLPSFLTIVDNGDRTAKISGSISNGDEGTYSITIEANDGTTSIFQNYILIVGAKIEDWESNNFTTYSWINSSPIPWTISNTNSENGIYSAKSGAISNSSSTSLSISLNVLQTDSIQFYKKVSSEASYDFLHFYIDGVEKNKWSGEINWSEESFLVDSGTHVFEWKYSKDGADIFGSDCAWIDFIIFPKYDNLTFINNQESSDKEFKIYPNPLQNVVNIEFESTQIETINFEIYNEMGQIVKNKNANISIGKNKILFDLNDLTSGVYYIKSNVDKQAIFRKIIIIK